MGGKVFWEIGASERWRPLFWQVFFGVGEGIVEIRDHRTAMWQTLALGGEPTDDMAFEAIFAEDFPDGFALAGGGGYRDDLAVCMDLGEASDAVVIGVFPGGDGGPEHRRELRLEGGEIS